MPIDAYHAETGRTKLVVHKQPPDYVHIINFAAGLALESNRDLMFKPDASQHLKTEQAIRGHHCIRCQDLFRPGGLAKERLAIGSK